MLDHFSHNVDIRSWIITYLVRQLRTYYVYSASEYIWWVDWQRTPRAMCNLVEDKHAYTRGGTGQVYGMSAQDDQNRERYWTQYFANGYF